MICKCRIYLVIAYVFMINLFIFSVGGSNDLDASVAQLPGLSDSPDKGAFIDLIKALDDVYSNGKVTIRVYPFTRSVNNVLTGLADFHIPAVRNPKVDQSKLPYNTVEIPMGKVVFVIYSNTNKPITKMMLDNAIVGKDSFPYSIELPGGIENQFPFNAVSSNNIELSLKKLSLGRIDALVWAQEEVDSTLKNLKIKNIKREFWMDFDDVIIIPKGVEGDKLNKLLSAQLLILKKNGKLGSLHLKIHHPYDKWQPEEMGW